MLPLSPGGLDDDDGSEQMEEHSPTLAPIADAPAGPPGKKKGRGKGKPAPYVWKDELISKLITEWRQEQILYNVKDPNYSNKDMRAAILERITTKMATYVPRNASVIH